MRYRVLTVGTDVDLLSTRQALLRSRGYDSLITTFQDFDEKLRSGKFDLIVFSVTLSQEEKHHIRAKLPDDTRLVELEALVWPEDLLRIVAEALEQT
jgi:hypothetical protein